MRLLHEIVVSGHVLRIERAEGGLNHYFVSGREVSVSKYLEMTGEPRAEAERRLRLQARSA